MTLDELLAQADSGSVALRVARSGVEAAREAAVGADRATLLPDLSLSATVGYLGDGYGWGRDSSYSFPVPMPHFSTRFGLAAQQVIYAGGALSFAGVPGILADRCGGSYLPAYLLFSAFLALTLLCIALAYRENGKRAPA